MCGIWGSLGFRPDPDRIDVVRHRGPDGRGWNVFNTPIGPLALGHRRLAIIDTSDDALQPMTYANGRYWLTYNGEIYNYLELRAELVEAGYTFSTHSDTEVLLLSYAHWGEQALDRLVGMFAFLIWDDQEKKLFAARDRFGIKPLYYFSSPQGIAFASEIKQLLGLPGEPRRMNVARVLDFLSSGICEHTDETMFSGVQQLRGGECLHLNLASWRPGDPVAVRRWYSVLTSGGLDLDEEQAACHFRELLTESIRIHLRSDVPIGSCLSGGLDSSAIVCLIDRLQTVENINTFSACYADKAVDEKPFMDAVVAATRSRPHYVYPHVDDAIAKAEQITWHQDEPYGSTSIFAQWSVFEAAHNAGVKVMLDGQGADEQLAGYHSAFGFYYAQLLRSGQLLTLWRAMLQRQEFHGVSLQQQIRGILMPLLPSRLANIARQRRLALTHHDWLGSAVLQAQVERRSAFDIALAKIGMERVNGIGDLCVALTHGSNLAMLLHWEDRNSMAHSVEARVPFLDHRLVEFAIGLGDRHKIVLGDTKRVLRRALASTLPGKIVERRDKLGFSTPEQTWFRGPLREAIEAGLEATFARFPDLLNVTGTRALAADMLDGRRPVDFTLWRIVNLGIWGRVFNVTI